MSFRLILATAFGAVAIGIVSCGGSGDVAEPTVPSTPSDAVDLRNRTLINPTAYIPSQCYTKTEDAAGKVHNPCYACHLASVEPNYLDDGDVQLGYDFPGDAQATIDNPWSNLFKDRTAAIAAISDEQILSYVRHDNYLAEGGPALARKLTTSLPATWDVNANGRWDGFVPDASFRFDDEGFDVTSSGARSAWRAFAYAPFLGTFWPTNGSTDDVLIRLGAAFREDESGAVDWTIYKTNLAVVSALILRKDVALEQTVDETRLQVDLDKDGRLAAANVVRFEWAPLQGRQMSYVGRARVEQAGGRIHLAAGLFPEGTEFLHSVRYLDVDASGQTNLSARFKELRYAVKTAWYTYSDLQEMARREVREKNVNPERTRQFTGSAETGLGNGQGWVYQGFIEDRRGELRPQTYEETAFCIGCHSGIGATTDGAFAFPRRFGTEAFRSGWYHWSQRGLAGTPEPQRSDGRHEYALYLELNGAGDEFRANDEVQSRFFDADGALRPEEIALLHSDVTRLLWPSRARALATNKAYKTIVDEQSFGLGRDTTLRPVVNVYSSIQIGTPTGIAAPTSGP